MISQSISLDNVLDVFMEADHLIIDELKINAMKFISLNIVSFLEIGNIEKLMQLPVYLIRDLENFMKLQDYNKFLFFNMRSIDEAIY